MSAADAHPPAGDGRAALAVDVALAAAVTAATLVSVAVSARDEEQALPVAACLVAACTAWPLAWRRVRPVTVWAAVLVATAAYGIAGWPDPAIYLGGLIALFTVADVSPRRRSVPAGVITLAVAVLAWWVDPSPTDLNDLLTPLLAATTVWLAGYSTHLERERVSLLRDREARIGHEHRRDMERAVDGERLRIARDLHDVTAHHVTAIAVQAEAGLADPRAAPGALTAVASTARAALVDLRRVVGVLRGDGASRHADPVIDGLDDLARPVRAAGIDVEVAVGGGPVKDDGAERSAYRIVQEALTNAARHSGARHVGVRVALDDETVTVEVTDDGRGPGPGLREGNGLAGIRERVAQHRGTLALEPRHPTGLALRARLAR